jgi:hypothetical protein
VKKADTHQETLKPTYDELVKAFADVVDKFTERKTLTFARCEEIIEIRGKLQ